jgi:hypothetical protein
VGVGTTISVHGKDQRQGFERKTHRESQFAHRDRQKIAPMAMARDPTEERRDTSSILRNGANIQLCCTDFRV